MAQQESHGKGRHTIMQLLLLTVGLGLASVLHAMKMLPAEPKELEGEWHILRWMGSPMIPDLAMTSPSPPHMDHAPLHFWMELSKDSMVIKVKLRQPSGHCEEIHIPLWKTEDPTKFMAGKQQEVHIWATKMKSYYVMHTKKELKDKPMHMMMLIGHTMEESPEAVKMFGEFVETKGLDKTEMMAPPHPASPDFCKSHHR